MALPDICGDKNFADFLTESAHFRGSLTEDLQFIFNEPEPVRPRRGRREALDGSTLENRRHRLVAIFEAAWGDIGWKLQKCKKTNDLIGIFNAIQGSTLQDVLTVFCTPSTLPPSRLTWRNLRHQLRELIEPQYEASNVNSEATERLQRANAALAQAQGRELKLARKEFAKCKQDADRASAEYRQINEKQRNLTGEMRFLDASIARWELFRFLKSKRYELTPLHLANAAAGLPEIGCRRSVLRCAKECRSTPREGVHYVVFKAIRYLNSKSVNKTAQALVEHFRETVPFLPKQYSLAKRYLAENWLFLERALRQICKAKPHPKAFPYEVTARFLKQMQVQSHTDILLAQRAKLDLLSKPADPLKLGKSANS